MWLEMWASREILLQGDKVVEALTPFATNPKVQVNDARHAVTLVSYKGGSTRDTGYYYIII